MSSHARRLSRAGDSRAAAPPAAQNAVRLGERPRRAACAASPSSKCALPRRLGRPAAAAAVSSGSPRAATICERRQPQRQPRAAPRDRGAGRAGSARQAERERLTATASPSPARADAECIVCRVAMPSSRRRERSAPIAADSWSPLPAITRWPPSAAAVARARSMNSANERGPQRVRIAGDVHELRRRRPVRSARRCRPAPPTTCDAAVAGNGNRDRLVIGVDHHEKARVDVALAAGRIELAGRAAQHIAQRHARSGCANPRRSPPRPPESPR